MSDIQIKPPATPVERAAFEARLDKLGIQVDDNGRVDPKSVEGLAAGDLQGMDALRSVLGADGVLTHGATAKLSRARAFASLSVGRAASIDEKQTNALRNVNMALDGLKSSLDAITGQLKAYVEGTGDFPPRDAVQAITRKTAHVFEATKKAFPKGKDQGLVDPAVISEFADRLASTADASSVYLVAMSSIRTFYKDKKIPLMALLQQIGRATILGMLGGAVRQTEMLRDLASQAAGWVETQQSAHANEAPRSDAQAKADASEAVQFAQARARPKSGGYRQMANDLASGLFSSRGVKDLAAKLEELDKQTNLGLDALKDGFDLVIGMNIVHARSGSAAELLLATTDLVVANWEQNKIDVQKKADAGDLYAALGVHRDAKPEEIKAQFRSLALQFHPDKNPGDAEAERRMKQIASANTELSDPEKRAKYDRKSPDAGTGYRRLTDDPIKRMEAEMSRDDILKSLSSHEFLIEMVEKIARENPNDPKAFLAVLKKALDDGHALRDLVNRTKNQMLLLPAPTNEPDDARFIEQVYRDDPQGALKNTIAQIQGEWPAGASNDNPAAVSTEAGTQAMADSISEIANRFGLAPHFVARGLEQVLDTFVAGSRMANPKGVHAALLQKLEALNEQTGNSPAELLPHLAIAAVRQAAQTTPRNAKAFLDALDRPKAMQVDVRSAE